MMPIKDAIDWLKSIKDKYIHGGDDAFDEKRKEAIDIAIKELEQKEKGYMRQQIERNIQYEILTDSKKARAFVQLQKSIQNFLLVVGDIDMHLVIKPWKDGEE